MPKILVIDDEKKFRDIYKELFEPLGIDILEAKDGLEAANVLMQSASSLDLIILDITIPEMDGRDICEMIKDYTSKLPIVISSVFPVNDQKLKIPGARDYFSKTQNKNVLKKKVEQILGI